MTSTLRIHTRLSEWVMRKQAEQIRSAVVSAVTYSTVTRAIQEKSENTQQPFSENCPQITTKVTILKSPAFFGKSPQALGSSANSLVPTLSKSINLPPLSLLTK